MKRIKAACIEQIIHFQLKEEVEHDMAVKMVQEEYAGYKQRLDHTSTRYKVVHMDSGI